MRRLTRTAGMAAMGFVLALGVAGATDRDEQAPEARAYMSLSFGGEKAEPRDLHYGLRLDHDSRFVEGAVPPMMQFDYTKRGLNDARVNGLSVLKQQYRLRQAEEAAAEGAGEAAAEEGFFSGMWNGVKNFFGGLFGGDDEEGAEAAAEEGAPVEEAAAEEVAEGMFMGYNAVDWGLLAVGAVGVGFAGSEVAGGKEDPDSVAQGGADGGDGPACDICDPAGDCFAPDETCLPLLTPVARAAFFGNDPARTQWLDGGTGQMGDLLPQRD